MSAPPNPLERLAHAHRSLRSASRPSLVGRPDRDLVKAAPLAGVDDALSPSVGLSACIALFCSVTTILASSGMALFNASSTPLRSSSRTKPRMASALNSPPWLREAAVEIWAICRFFHMSICLIFHRCSLLFLACRRCLRRKRANAMRFCQGRGRHREREGVRTSRAHRKATAARSKGGGAPRHA